MNRLKVRWKDMGSHTHSSTTQILLLLLVLGCAVILPGCGKETRVTRVDTDVVTDFSGRWNDTDSQQVAKTMVNEMVSQPWLGNFTRDNGKPPVVIVGTIMNRSHGTY